MNKRILMSSLLAVAGMSGLMAGMAEAFAQSSAEELEPIVYFLVDTSRSMNNIMAPKGYSNTNNTRLTRALGEIAGASKNYSGSMLRRDSESTPKQFTLPYSVWQSGGYSNYLKTIGPESDAAYPNTNSTDANDVAYDNAYGDDGIIQLYKDKVKFGFAGFAVGSNDGGSGISEIEANVEALGGEIGKYLRFTLVWGEEYQSCSDIDLHAYVYESQSKYEQGRYVDHIYYSSEFPRQKSRCSRYGCEYGNLDIDNLNPSNYTSYKSHEEANGVWSGYENIYWNDISNIGDGYIIEMKIHNYSLNTSNYGSCKAEKKFRTEIAIPDENGCKIYYNIGYKGSLSNKQWNPVATVRYDASLGTFVPNFSDDELDSTRFDLLTSGMINRPDNIYGLNKHTYQGVTYGLEIPDDYKHNKHCNFNVGIWDSVGPWHYDERETWTEKVNSVPAPLNYPTAYNSPEMIQQSNLALAKNVRSYTATAATPIGESLADLYYLFGAKDEPNYKLSADEAVYKQPNGTSKPQEDDYYNCRPKAVVLITDGGPNGSGIENGNRGDHGNREKVWYDAENLNNAKIKVFPVGYAEFDLTEDELKIDLSDDRLEGNDAYKSKKDKLNSIHTLNKMALYGGTCRDPNTHKLLSIDDLDGAFKSFDDKVDNDSVELKDKTCFYYAADSTALRAALVSALSEMLKGDYSKTKVVKSNSVGLKTNSSNHGYYTVYSGYSTSLAPIRKSRLQREATVCDTSTGKFVNDVDQFLDIAHRLKCRLTSCDMWRAATNSDVSKHPDKDYVEGMNYLFQDDEQGTSYIKRAGFNHAPTACAKLYNSYNITKASDNANNCLNERNIFSARYNTSGAEDGDRYAISTFARNSKLSSSDSGMLKNVSLSSSDYGVIPKSKDNGTGAYHFATNNKDNKCIAGRTSDSGINKSIYEQYSDVNYLVSPYECFDDMDCGISGSNSLRHCDLGRCIDSSAGSPLTITSCSSNSNIGSDICINHERRRKGSACSSHSMCAAGQVCHAGYCVTGIVKDCDIRQYIATQPLGVIEYATPVTIDPPSRPYRSSDYIKFANKYKNRDIMLMAGANDGMLHSFVLGNNQGTYEEGDERWAFIPKLMMPKLSSLINQDHSISFINGTPVVADVKLPGFTIDDDAWRTVLVGGFRNGGRGYYALDITNADQPLVLWEIDNQWSNVGTSHKTMGQKDGIVTTLHPSFPFELMGYSYAEPVITKMLIDNVPEPVAILSGGMPESDLSEAEKNVDRTGGVMFIVRLFPTSKSDLIVKTFYFDNPLTGTPSVFPNNFNSTAQQIYVGDSKGQLYRLSVTSDNSSNWGSEKTGEFEEPIFKPTEMVSGDDSVQFSSITFAPAVSLYSNDGGVPVIQVAFGTGSNDSFYVSKNDNHYFASFLDVPVSENGAIKYKLNQTDGYSFNPSVTILNANNDLSFSEKGPNDEYVIYSTTDPTLHRFEKGQKLTGAPITYNYATYFPTFIVSDNSDEFCPVGGAAIWKVESESGPNSKKITNTLDAGKIQKNQKSGADISDPFFVAGERRSYYQLGDGTKIYGLEITSMQYCANSAYGSTSLTVPPQLIAQTSADSMDEHSIRSDKRSSELLGSASNDIPAIALELEAIAPVITPSIWTSVYE